MIIMSKIELYEDYNRSPWLCPSWLRTECMRQLRYRLNRVDKTANLNDWNSTPHNTATEDLAKILRQKDFAVLREEKIQHEFPGFILAHWFDIIAIKDGQYQIIEVKPRDRSYYQSQYNMAQLLANTVFQDYNYYVHEYETGEFIPKVKPDFDEVISTIQSKLDATRVELPMENPSKACDFCPYATCEYHPQHDCDLLSGPFGEEECGCNV